MQLSEKQHSELIEIRNRINENALKLTYLPEDLRADHPLLQAAEHFRQGLAQLSLFLDHGPQTWKDQQKSTAAPTTLEITESTPE